MSRVFSLLNFLFVEKKESLGPGCMAEQEAELPTRPSGPSASGLSVDKATKPCYAKNGMKKKLTQGITDFKEFIDNDCYFVDKTHLIAHLIDDPSKVHLITRPRRFGKTLNLSMIRHFLEAPLPPHTGNPLFAPENTSSPPPETLRSNTLPSVQSRTQNSQLPTPTFLRILQSPPIRAVPSSWGSIRSFI